MKFGNDMGGFAFVYQINPETSRNIVFLRKYTIIIPDQF